MKRICIWLIRFYQKYISPRKSKPTCRFYPSCSAFALEAFEKRGFFAGSALTFFRILRCNPFCPGGYDPVPEKGITIRSYWATHGRGQFLTDDDQQNTDEPDQTAEASSLSDAPTAGGNSSDHRETAAETDDTPKAACARYRQGEKTL